MFLKFKSNRAFSPIADSVLHTTRKLGCSGAATFVNYNDSIVLEEYLGKQSNTADARKVQGDTQFHVASVRKSYIGFAVAYAIFYGKIKSIDDLILNYLPDLDKNVWKGTTIRHLLTHTHGLQEVEGTVIRENPVGENWTYRQVGINALTKIIRRTTHKTISEIVHEQVFEPLGFNESN